MSYRDIVIRDDAEPKLDTADVKHARVFFPVFFTPQCPGFLRVQDIGNGKFHGAYTRR